MRRKIATLLGTVMVAGVISLSSMPVASAQTGYPPGPCIPADSVIDAGSHAIGTTFSFRLIPVCLWDPGATIVLTVNGQAAGSKIADAGGGITVNVTVVSATQLSINDPVLVNGQCGRNSATGTGPSAAARGDQVSATANFNVVCNQAAAAASAVPGSIGGIAFTGANILKWGGIALGLMAGGWLLVGVARRRRANPTA